MQEKIVDLIIKNCDVFNENNTKKLYKNCKFYSIIFNSCDFDNCIIINCKFEDCKFINCSFKYAQIIDSILNGCFFIICDLTYFFTLNCLTKLTIFKDCLAINSKFIFDNNKEKQPITFLRTNAIGSQIQVVSLVEMCLDACILTGASISLITPSTNNGGFYSYLPTKQIKNVQMKNCL